VSFTISNQVFVASELRCDMCTADTTWRIHSPNDQYMVLWRSFRALKFWNGVCLLKTPYNYTYVKFRNIKLLSAGWSIRYFLQYIHGHYPYKPTRRLQVFIGGLRVQPVKKPIPRSELHHKWSFIHCFILLKKRTTIFRARSGFRILLQSQPAIISNHDLNRLKPEESG